MFCYEWGKQTHFSFGRFLEWERIGSANSGEKGKNDRLARHSNSAVAGSDSAYPAEISPTPDFSAIGESMRNFDIHRAHTRFGAGSFLKC
jgi:hypothetical protein